MIVVAAVVPLMMTMAYLVSETSVWEDDDDVTKTTRVMMIGTLRVGDALRSWWW